MEGNCDASGDYALEIFKKDYLLLLRFLNFSRHDSSDALLEIMICVFMLIFSNDRNTG